MKDFFEDLGKAISDTAEQVGKKTEEIVEVQRLKGQISTMHRSNERDFGDLGKIVYEQYEAGTILDQELVVLCENISKREEEIEELGRKIKKAKGYRICTHCEEPVEERMSFCPNCGTKVEPEEEQQEKAENMVQKVIEAEGTVVETKETVAEVVEDGKKE